jgi:hypothetical protein
MLVGLVPFDFKAFEARKAFAANQSTSCLSFYRNVHILFVAAAVLYHTIF